MKHHLPTLLRAAAAACAFFVAACDPSVGPPVAQLMPKAGLQMTIETYDTDVWGVKRPGTSEIRYVTISPDTTRIAGRSNVSRYVIRATQSTSVPGDTMFVHYADNGDVAILQRLEDAGPLEIEDRWAVYPIGSRGSRSYDFLDTSFTVGSQFYTYNERWMPGFLGTETLDTGMVLPVTHRADLATLKAELLQTVTTSENMGLRLPITNGGTLWFSPKLGAIVRMESSISWIENGEKKGAGSGFRIVSWRTP